MLRRQFSAFVASLLTCGSAWAAAPSELDVGVALFNQGKYSEAVAHLSAAQSVPSFTARALYYRALAELKLGRKTATDTLRALVALAPDSAEGKMAARYLSAASGGTETAQPPALRLQDQELLPLPEHIKLPYTQGRDGWMHVKATINTNQTVDMVWDTGASNCSIPANIYGRVPEDAKPTIVETPLGKEPAYITRIPIQVGSLKRSAITTLMSGTAVIGQSFFRDYAVEVDSIGHVIYLDRLGAGPRPKSDTSTPDSGLYIGADGSVRRVPHKGAMPPPPTHKPQYPVHFERESGLLLITILVDQRPIQAYFDTGCAAKGIAMSSAMAASARDRLVQKANKKIEHQKIVNLALGPIELQDVKVTIANGLSRPLVGPAILGKRGYRIDPAKQQIDFDMFED